MQCGAAMQAVIAHASGEVEIVSSLGEREREREKVRAGDRVSARAGARERASERAASE